MGKLLLLSLGSHTSLRDVFRRYHVSVPKAGSAQRAIPACSDLCCKQVQVQKPLIGPIKSGIKASCYKSSKWRNVCRDWVLYKYPMEDNLDALIPVGAFALCFLKLLHCLFGSCFCSFSVLELSLVIPGKAINSCLFCHVMAEKQDDTASFLIP